MNMDEQLTLVTKLAQNDKELMRLQGVLRNGPTEVKQYENEVEAARDKLAQTDKELEETRAERGKADGDLATLNRRLDQARANSKRVTTEQQMKANQTEIAALQAKCDAKEEEIIVLMNRLESLDKALPECKTALEEAEVMFETTKEAVPETMKKAKVEMQERIDQRNKYGMQLDVQVRRQYEVAIRQKGRPLTTVLDQICQSCHTKVPPQFLVEHAQGRDIHTCLTCKRIITKVMYSDDEDA